MWSTGPRGSPVPDSREPCRHGPRPVRALPARRAGRTARVLPQQWAGMLAVRRRWFDVLLMLGAGAVIWLVALVVPPQ